MTTRQRTLGIGIGKSLAASFNTVGVNVEDHKNYTIHLVSTGGGSPTGTFTVQYSNDAGTTPYGDDTGVTNWFTDPGIPAPGPRMWEFGCDEFQSSTNDDIAPTRSPCARK